MLLTVVWCTGIALLSMECSCEQILATVQNDSMAIQDSMVSSSHGIAQYHIRKNSNATFVIIPTSDIKINDVGLIVTTCDIAS